MLDDEDESNNDARLTRAHKELSAHWPNLSNDVKEFINCRAGMELAVQASSQPRLQGDKAAHLADLHTKDAMDPVGRLAQEAADGQQGLQAMVRLTRRT